MAKAPKHDEPAAAPVKSSLEETNAASAAVARAPRVDLKDIEQAIHLKYEFTAGAAIAALEMPPPPQGILDVMSMCILVMHNGFIIVGKSAPASPLNFNAELGRQFAYEDAVRQLWPLMGFLLKTRLNERPAAPPPQP